MRRIGLVAVVLALVACGAPGHSPATTTPAPTIDSTPVNTTPIPVSIVTAPPTTVAFVLTPAAWNSAHFRDVELLGQDLDSATEIAKGASLPGYDPNDTVSICNLTVTATRDLVLDGPTTDDASTKAIAHLIATASPGEEVCRTDPSLSKPGDAQTVESTFESYVDAESALLAALTTPAP